jgi:hypothetical protein
LVIVDCLMPDARREEGPSKEIMGMNFQSGRRSHELCLAARKRNT